MIKMIYSQNNEETFIVEYFQGKAPGKFIDIGAFDVYMFSNVRKLYEMGWSGILVEPSPSLYRSISDHYAAESRIEVLNCAVGAYNGDIDFYESTGDAVSTTDENHMNKWNAAGVPYNKIRVQQVNVADFMSSYCKDVDFLSIDTEATNITLFRKTPDFVFEQIKMLCIEHDNNKEEIETRLKKYGFTTRYVNAENIILAK